MIITKTDTYDGLQLKDEQHRQVSSESKIRDALKHDNCLGFYAYEGQVPIGFALLRQFAEGQFFLWTFIVDCRYQGHGKGKEFLRLLIGVLSEQYSAQIITTTYLWGNIVAKNLYERAGFVETDVVNEDGIHEVNMKLSL